MFVGASGVICGFHGTWTPSNSFANVLKLTVHTHCRSKFMKSYSGNPTGLATISPGNIILT